MVSEFTNASVFSIRAPLYVSWAGLLDHLIRPQQKRLRNRQSECLGCLQVDGQLELRRLLHGKIGGLGAFEDFVRVAPQVPEQRNEVCLIRHETARRRRTPGAERSPVARSS